MSVGREVIKQVEELVIQKLIQNGMQVCSAGITIRSLPGGCSGFVGLNRATKKTGGLLQIGPVIGVRHEEMEKMVAELSGIQFQKCSPFPISESLGYLMPEKTYLTWSFGADAAQNHETVDSMVKAIIDYGFPFMDQHGSLRAIVGVLQSPRKVNSPVTCTRLPVGLYLLGDRNAATTALGREVAKFGNRSDEEAMRFRRFTDAFRALLKP